MLESKRITAYGKRSSRIVYVSDEPRAARDSPFKAHRPSRENTTSNSPPSARKVLVFPRRKVHGLSTSPRGSPKSGNVLGIASKKAALDTSPKRRPLGLKAANVTGSPSVVFLGQRSTQTPNAKPSRFAPFVDDDVVVIEDSATGAPTQARKKINKPRVASSQLRQTEEDVEVVRPSRRRAPKRAVVITDEDEEEDEEESTLRRMGRGARARPIVVSSDDSSDDYPKIVAVKPAPNSHALRSTKTRQNLEPEGLRQSTRRLQAEVTFPNSQQPSQPKPPRAALPPLAPKPAPPARPRSPRRSQRKALPPSQHPTVSSTSELELSFAALSLSADAQPRPSSSKRALQYLAPLLAECAQSEPHCFNTFIETFPFDDIHGHNPSDDLAFRKIGEASYSEVFAIGDVVLKIVPLREDSSGEEPSGEEHVDSGLDLPQESDTKDVLQEMIVTRAMGQICPGFIKLLRTYIVLGPYPSLLLSLWDEFNDNKSSENIRPDIFPPIQAYALLVLPHGGPDLEAYTFPVKTGWRQACSIFWQTVKALATAEELVSFEHRDLHWGQILVKSSTPARKVTPKTPARRRAAVDTDEGEGVPMDHPLHGVTATVIDLGLARMDAGDGVQWTPFDDLIFEGEGDYQFDVYRLMKRIHGDTWDQYRPLTNIMWLHYLTTKLLRSKRLRPPGKRGGISVAGEFGEKECHECLVEVEQLLGACISQTKGKKGRGGSPKEIFCKAGDMVYFARGRGWLE